MSGASVPAAIPTAPHVPFVSDEPAASPESTPLATVIPDAPAASSEGPAPVADVPSIAFLAVYFGRLRDDFPLWLHTCAHNPSIDWLLITDDRRPFAYPPNVRVIYGSLAEVAARAQALFDFPISLDTPYRLCDFKPAYGELFAEELRGYDFWGHCDLDLMWGDIRTFLTPEVLASHDKIGFVGNCTLYRNTPENNARYRGRNRVGEELHRRYLAEPRCFCFDEVGINDIFLTDGARIYREVVFSDLASNRANFRACFAPNEFRDENLRVIYEWVDGRLYHVAEVRGELRRREMMFVHFLNSRHMWVAALLPSGAAGEAGPMAGARPMEESAANSGSQAGVAAAGQAGAVGVFAAEPLPRRFLIVPDAYLPFVKPTPALVRRWSRPRWASCLAQGLRSRLHHPRGVLGWIKMVTRYNWWLNRRSEVFNYWVWTHYEADDQAGRMDLLGDVPPRFGNPA